MTDEQRVVIAREIDAIVAEKVMGTPFRKPGHGPCCTCQVCGWDFDNCQCGYSTDIEKAWRVVEKLAPVFYWKIGTEPVQRTYCQFWTPGHEAVIAYADTAPLAICKAALKAMEGRV